METELDALSCAVMDEHLALDALEDLVMEIELRRAA